MSFLSWEWIGPLSLLLALLAWLLGRVAQREPRWRMLGRVLLVLALCVLAVWAAGYVAFFGTWLYWPALRVFGANASALQSAVYLQAGVMTVGVLVLLRKHWARLYPVAVFLVVVFWFAGWLTVNPETWLPAQS
ncbi:hypothetical protein [Mycolicibacterium brumae]|uniref:hypothetical protein n=1 Tax=Mycolicibacterium brumae TaxID=85968 RepID=UPI000FE26C1D|nr:hypothetical protein [Mycolicibacterium brumae]MCV7193719.1 hypothetical protein [Mycolicibacterium brumae]UWW09010.1 hypothetical protein L2Z93_002091 [Mycolicibacterium brumae]